MTHAIEVLDGSNIRHVVILNRITHYIEMGHKTHIYFSQGYPLQAYEKFDDFHSRLNRVGFNAPTVELLNSLQCRVVVVLSTILRFRECNYYANMTEITVDSSDTVTVMGNLDTVKNILSRYKFTFL